MLSFKGHVHFGIGRCINPRLEEMMDAADRNAVVRKVCSIIDESIHASYMIYPVNYVAYDMLHGEYSCSAHYTHQQAEEFRNYIEGQLDKVALPDISADDRDYMRTMMLTMYANPLRNKRKAHRSLGLPDEC